MEYISSSVKRHNKILYIVAVLLAIAIIYCELNKLRGSLPSAVGYIEKLTYSGYISIYLFVIVMFMGTMSRKISLTKYFMKIRAELAIIASVLIVPHIYIHGMKLILALMGSKTLTTDRIIYSIAGVIALVIMIPLFITSFNFVKRKLRGGMWKKIQRWSYAFYGLIYIHILFAYLNEKVMDIKNITILSVVFGAYTVLRIMKAFSEKSKRKTHLYKY
ncbi:MAG: ferric reductase-like transmembrane domain-containing protein [Clostridium perfringens]|nr:ferric reductase-like transmembrane domain-containing protein [Clostridium perfringens]